MRVCGTLLTLVGALSPGCAATQSGATVEDLSRARTQTAEGATIFTNQCAKCHGQRGEGLGGVPAILGPGALPAFPRSGGMAGDPTMTDPQQLQIQQQTRPAGAASRDTFRTAQDLFNFTKARMPKTSPGSLTDGQYWAAVNFLLAAQGANPPPGGIGPTNAASIPIPRP